MSSILRLAGWARFLLPFSREVELELLGSDSAPADSAACCCCPLETSCGVVISEQSHSH